MISSWQSASKLVGAPRKGGQKTSTKADAKRIHRNPDAPLWIKRCPDVVIRLAHKTRPVGRRVVTAVVWSSSSLQSLQVLVATVVVEVDEHVVTL